MRFRYELHLVCCLTCTAFCICKAPFTFMRSCVAAVFLS